MCFAIFPLHLSKVLLLPRKSDARSYEVLHLSRKIISANLRSDAAKCNPSQRPDLLTSLMNMSLVLRLPRKMHLCRSSSNVPRLPSFLEMLQNPLFLLTFDKVHNPLRLPRGTTSKPSKVVQACRVFWLGKVLRATTVCTFSPELRCFAHFDLEICFVPQRRALFQHLNFQKCSEPGVFCTFWLRNVLRATTACTFSTSQLPEVVYFSTLRSHKSLGKHSVSRLSYLFAHLDLLSSDFLLFDLLFSSILFSDSSHLCFSSVHIVGSLTSKLPEIMIIFHQYSSGI